MPGFPGGLKEFSEFAGNINIIAGANGTGKSSTGRIIKRLIWWDRISGVKADSEVLIDDSIHRIRIDHSDYIHIDGNHNTTNSDLSYLVPSNYADRYTLALHDLVREDDRSLAEEIVREVNGGIDIKSSVKELKYSNTIYNANIQSYKDWQKAYDRCRKASAEEDLLREKLRKVESLRRERQQAESAHKDIQFYSLYSSYLEKLARLEELQSKIKEYDQALDNMRSEDYQEVIRLDKSLEEKKAEIDGLKRDVSTIEQHIGELTTADTGVEEWIIEELEQSAKLLSESENRAENLRRDIVRNRVILEESASAIGIKDNLSGKFKYSLDKLNDIEDLVRRANSLQQEYDSLIDRKERLGSDIEETRAAITIINPDAEKIKSGILALSQWLQEGPGERRDMKSELWSVAILGILTAVATYFLGWAGLLGVVPMIIVTVVLISLIKKRTKSNISLRKEDYLKTGLEPLLYWSREEVIQRILFLMEQEGLLLRLRELKSEEKRISDQLLKYEERMEELSGEVSKAISDTSFKSRGMSPGKDTFHYFIGKIERWQAASIELKGLERELEGIVAKEQTLINRANTHFATCRCGEADSILSFNALLSTLKRQEESRKSLNTEKRHKEELLERNIKLLADIEAALGAIYLRLALENRSRSYLKKLSEQLEEYVALRKEIEMLKSLISVESQRLKDSDLSYILNEDLSLEESRLRLERADVLYKKYGAIIEEISEIEAEVRQREGDNALEKALNEKDEAVENLTAQFNENLASITGALIAEQLQKEISFNNDNVVFREANKILDNITHSRYSLILSDSQFRAKDNISSQTLSLDELSTGTRVQLLLAIRLAFIHAFERGERLPVIADELLANSDDKRSDAIINSLIEISKERQIFYFTAQADEVAKWRNYLDKSPEISSDVFILGDKRNEFDIHVPEYEPVVLIREIPAPEDVDRKQYFDLIEVPGFNVIEQSPEELHLWYLIEDLQLLYNLLRRGVGRWGQLKSFHVNGGVMEGLDETMWSKIEQKIELLDRYGELYKVGRPRKIEKDVIEKSGIISSVFLDQVLDLLEKEEGDPQRLLESLVALPLFRAHKIEELREYFMSEKIIDDKPKLSPGELNIRLQAIISSLGIDAVEAERFIKVIFSGATDDIQKIKEVDEPLLFSLVLDD